VVERRSTEERQEEIADAALRILATRGLGALTVSALAKELGLTGGALYRHFPSTDAILEAVSARVVAVLVASLPDPSLAPLAWLERFIESRANTVSGHAGLARLLFSDQLALALPEPALVHLRGVVKTTGQAIVRALLEGQRRGEIRADVEPMELVPIVMGAVQMLALSQAGTIVPPHLTSSSRIWETLRRLLEAPATRGAPAGRVGPRKAR
jgi:AcrR family transcriptional regulator